MAQLLVRMQMVHTLWKTVWQFVEQLNKHSKYELAVTLLGIYSREKKKRVDTEISWYTVVLCYSLLPKLQTIKYLSSSECIMQTGILFGNEKKWITNTFSIIDESQRHTNLKRSQAQRLYIVWFHLYDTLEKVKLKE